MTIQISLIEANEPCSDNNKQKVPLRIVNEPHVSIPMYIDARSLSTVMIVAVLASIAPVHGEEQTSIVIPAIIHRWKLPGDDAKPETTIEEMARCMGSNMRIQERYQGFLEKQKAADAEYAVIESEAVDLQNRHAQIEVDRQRLDDQLAAHTSKSSALEVRRLAIERAKSSGKTTAAEAKELNAKISAYNREAQENNKLRTQLKTMSDEFNSKVASYNQTAAQHNGRANEFNVQNLAFRTTTDQFNEEIGAYKIKCTGEHMLK